MQKVTGGCANGGCRARPRRAASAASVALVKAAFERTDAAQGAATEDEAMQILKG